MRLILRVSDQVKITAPTRSIGWSTNGWLDRLNGFFALFLVTLAMGFTSNVSAQGTTLGAGDVAIIGASLDPDAFAFVLLRDITSGTVIHFTDNSWTSTSAGSANEGYATYTSPSAQTAGTVIRFTGSAGNGWVISGIALSNSGDNIFAYQGIRDNWTSQTGITILYGIVLRSGITASGSPTSNNTYVPASLAIGTTFIALPGTGYTNAYFANQSTATSTVTVSGTKAELLALFGATSNWYGSSSVVTYPTWNITVVTGPSISTTGALTAVSTTYGTASSAAQLTVNGTALTADVTVTPPAGFEVSKTSATTGFAATQTLTQTSGSVSGVVIYVRLKATTTAGNYSGNVNLQSNTVSVNRAMPSSTVSAKAITVTGAMAQDKVYDRTAAAVITGATASGLVNGDVITVAGGGTFTNINVNNDIPVTAALTLSGTNASSYALTQPTGLNADITPKSISLTNVVVADKIYDQTTAATVTANLSGVIAPDAVTLNISATFASAMAGNDVATVIVANLSGANAGNYSLSQTTGITADITPKTLTILDAVAQNKVYDGNTNAQITGTLDGVISPDSVMLVLQGTFASPEVGLDIPVTSTSFITGDVTNYVLQQPTGLDANISAEALLAQTITFNALPNVTYGDSSFALNATTTSGLMISYASSDESVATVNGNTVTILNAGTTTITATQAGDLVYEEAEPVAQVLTVVPKTLTLASAVAQDKIYDANTSAVITGTLNGVVGNDVVTFAGIGSFATANAGSAIAVTAAITISGADAANYTIAQPTALTANILVKGLTVTGASVADKVYDATTAATISGGSLAGVINNDNVTLNASAGTFASANAGMDIAVTSAFTLGGTAASNYSLTQPTNLNADITPRSVTISGLVASDKVYNATTQATLSGTPQVDGLIGQDEVVVSGMPTGTFANKNVGIDKTVVVSNITLSGAQAGNYTATSTTTALLADITVASVTIANAQAVDKTFDGTTSATITGTLSGVLGSDVVTLVGTGNFASSAIANDIAVTSTSTLAGIDAPNYVINPQPSGLTADIIQGPTVLTPGDLSIIGFQINSPDTFVFVPWVDLYPNTVIKFTDNGFLSSASANAPGNGRAGENVVIWNSGTTLIPAGTVVSIATTTPSIGTIVQGALTGLAGGGDNIFAYQGPATSGTAPEFNPTTGTSTFSGTIIYGLHVQGDGANASWLTSGLATASASYLPSELNFAGGNIAIGNSAQRGQFNGSRSNKTSFAQYKAAVNQASNWTTATGGTQTFNLAPFVLATPPTAAVIAGTTTICAGQNAQFTFTITGGTAPYQVVYTDGTTNYTLNGYVSGTAVTVSPSTSTTYTIVSVTDTNLLPAGGISGAAVITVNQFYTFYADNDFDGFGAGTSVSLCAVNATTPPTGYSVNNLDCDDERGSVNPDASEVAYNGVDDNCDGTIDEGSRITSQVVASQCAATLTSISSLISAVYYGNPINGYRFKVVNTITGAEQVIDRTQNYFSLTQLASYDYATTYEISVQLRRNGIWLNYYGPACLVSTPAILAPGGAAAISPSQCGSELQSISTLVATSSLPGVTGYRFRITDVVTNEVQQIDRNYNWFSMPMLAHYLYGRTYSVEVAFKTNGQYTGFGQPCTISTPPVPQLTECGAVIPTKGTLIATRSLNRVTSYRFELTNMNTQQTVIIERTPNYFSFQNVPGYVPGAQYAVAVSVMTAGEWSDFSEVCLITAPGSSAIAKGTIAEEQTDEIPSVAFRAVVYPNPYSESFALDMDVSSEENVAVKVYDMVGKLVENREFASDAIEYQQFGEKYPSGVYNIVVTQGANVKTLRIIKR